MSTTERWLPVAGFEGFYSVSSHGRVRSEARVVQYENGKRQSVRQRIMSPAVKRSGHLSVMLYGADKKRQRRHVHRMVLIAFGDPQPSPLHECAHNDGDPSNNRIGNLRWDTRSGNHQDKVVHGTHNRGERHPLCTIPDATVRAIRESKAKPADIAAAYGINYSYVRAIQTGTTRRYT